MKLHLIRHGQTDWNAEGRIQGWSESTLTRTGEEQALRRREALRDINFTLMWCSSSVRTRQTAALLVSDRSLPVSYSDALREMHLGPWEGRLWQEIQREDPERCSHFTHARHRFELEGAETFSSMQGRGVAAIEQIIDASDREAEVLVVSHGAIIKAILAYHAGLPISQLSEVPGLQNCSHSILEARERDRVVTLIDGEVYSATRWPALIDVCRGAQGSVAQ